MNGIRSLIPQKHNNHYSKAFKAQIIFEYFNQGLSSRQLAYKYNVRSSRTFRDWINKHIEGKENRSYSTISEVPIMKSRKTTLEERIEIVKFVMDKSRSYQEASAVFEVSYNQVYSWVQKYKKYGTDALNDYRGKKRPNTIMTKDEKLLAHTKALEAQIHYLEMENEILKKQAIEERKLMNKESSKDHHIK